jgi:hypothetical protein
MLDEKKKLFLYFSFVCGNNRIFYTTMCNMMHLLFLFIAMLKSKINSFETIYIKLWPIDKWELIVWLLSNVQVYETFCKSNIFYCGYEGESLEYIMIIFIFGSMLHKQLKL